MRNIPRLPQLAGQSPPALRVEPTTTTMPWRGMWADESSSAGWIEATGEAGLPARR